MLVAAKRRIIAGAPIAIDCPACGAAGVVSTLQHVEEPLLLLHLVPLFTLRNTFVRCGACGQTLAVAGRDLDGLYALPTAELSARLRPYVSGVGRVLVVISLLLFWFPFLAPVLALGGWYVTRRHRGWRRAATVAVVLSFLVLAAVVAVLVFAPRPPGGRVK